jgi:hypothetical protein
MGINIRVSKNILVVLNQLYEIEEKLKKNGDPHNLQRNVNKMKDAFNALEEFGLIYEDPMNQPFKETRTDLEATISGSGTDNLVVVEVIKPIIRAAMREGAGEFSIVVQKGIVVVESKRESST